MRSTFKVLFYLKRNKAKTQSAVPVMGRITVNGTISQFSAKLTVPERLWEVRGGAVPRGGVSKSTASIAIWTRSARSSTAINGISATGKAM